MPMVFSATALSMPALAASRPTSSSIFAPSPTSRLIGRLLKIDLERLRSEIQATHPQPDDFDSPSVAAMQDLVPIHAYLLRCVPAFFSLRSEKSMRSRDVEAGEYSYVRRERFQS